MDYRVSYLLARTLYQTAPESGRDRPASADTRGHAFSAQTRCPDAELRAYVRRQQRLRNLPLRAREAMRPRAVIEKSPRPEHD